MPYIIKYGELYLSDFFPTTWESSPAQALTFVDEHEATNTRNNLATRKRTGRREIIIFADQFEILWIDSPTQLWGKKQPQDKK